MKTFFNASLRSGLPFILLIIATVPGAALAQYTDDIRIELLLQTDTTSAGGPLFYPSVNKAEITILRITIRPGAVTGWHRHDIPLFAYVQQGTLSVRFEDGRELRFEEGSAVAEAIGVWHEGRNAGADDLILIAVYLGGDGLPLVTAKP